MNKKFSFRQQQELSLRNTKKNISQEKNILALDYGEKYCGLAFSPDGICALPMAIIPTDEISSFLKKILFEKKIQKIIFGLPLQQDGSENELCQKIRAFAKQWEPDGTVAFVNERDSSKSDIPISSNERNDDLAAARILEFYLSQM